MGSEDKKGSTYLIKNAPSDRVDAPSPSDGPKSAPPGSEPPGSEAPDGRWRTSSPPPGESLEAKWWPDRELGKAFRRWTGIPPARGDHARAVAMKFLVERLNVGGLTAVGSAPRTPLPIVEPPDFAARVRTMAVQLGMHGPNEEAPEHTALLAMGEDVLPILRDFFPGRLWFNRWEPHVQPPRGGSVSGLCRTLVAFGNRAAPYIVELLKSEDPETRYYATLVAAELPHPVLVEPLAATLFDDDQGVSRSALYALEVFDEQEGVEGLKESLRALAVASDTDQRSRLLAMRALAVLRDEQCVEALISALSERSVLGEAAWRVLRMLTAQDFGDREPDWRTWFSDNAGRSRVEWLIDSLDHEDPEIRAIASRDLLRASAQDYGYRVNMPRDDRRAIRERYRLWWSGRNDSGN
ncbi:MAG: HEAT repeat domain-containing protein [Deltaproteobacteria bacterium]|nr:HEAT repeat domain-containing protein [Deltaproteobacteria bacterium]MBW1874509.1 HEAT repeat domain-containing protein [Deltaproteobacteria bacterium]MBW2210281.1 HEAT repeat domain-containing protein [Deltaproteobacteria bacterium]MBW2378210.1 HEAT repeat domain-containing protein [Deltaproteobacteria bacterium]MBW2549274.1 HEAT repeat domain-containing protein [Deltaproteobacteria bacterium]